LEASYRIGNGGLASKWEPVPLPLGKQPVDCKWVYTVKFNPDGSDERLKALLVVKGYTQRYSIDYNEKFSPVAKISFVCVLISLAISIGPCFNWMSKTPFYMGIYMRKFIWSNYEGLLLGGSIRAVSIS